MGPENPVSRIRAESRDKALRSFEALLRSNALLEVVELEKWLRNAGAHPQVEIVVRGLLDTAAKHDIVRKLRRPMSRYEIHIGQTDMAVGILYDALPERLTDDPEAETQFTFDTQNMIAVSASGISPVTVTTRKIINGDPQPPIVRQSIGMDKWQRYEWMVPEAVMNAYNNNRSLAARGMRYPGSAVRARR